MTTSTPGRARGLVERALLVAPYLYVLRAPLLSGVALLLLPPVALRTGASPFLAGLFDVHAPGMALVALTAFTTAWTVMVTSWLILEYGSARFGLGPLGRALPRIDGKHVAIFALLALPVEVEVILFSGRELAARIGPSIGWASLGFVAALLLLLWARSTATRLQTFLAAEHPGLVGRLVRQLTARVAANRNLGEGYIDYEGRKPTLLAGHGLALLLFLASLAVWTLVGFVKSFWIGYPAYVPTLAYVLLLLMLLCWGVAALSFFFDRYRVPVLVPLLLLPTVTSLLPQSDHYYHVLPSSMVEPPAPSEAINANNRDAVIVVAAEGGGIQAAAWTARVLTGLELKCRQECGVRAFEFGRSIRFVSTVSGGSLGAMFFISQYSPAGLPDQAVLEQVVRTTQASSLDAVAWGLVYPDVLRTFFPFFQNRYVDRGQALETAWTRDAEVASPLGRWREGAKDGWRPGVVFNSTIADTGERLLFATTRMQTPRRGRRTFSDLYKNLDVSVVTAARLSATFPYVSPAARADVGGPWTPQVHVVDGGYYDNYGMVTLTEWLDEALSGAGRRVTRVLVLQLRGAPPERERPPGHRRGWFYQTFAPVSTMLNVRRAGQLSHNEAELSLLREAWRLKGVQIDTAIFQFCGERPPFSWHLTERQKREIQDEWERELALGTGWPAVKDFVLGIAPPPQPKPRRCE